MHMHNTFIIVDNASPYHEVSNGPVEYGVVVVAAGTMLQKVLACLRYL